MEGPTKRILALTFGLLAASWLGIEAEAGERVFCGKNHRMSITDLDMTPDPLERGQRVQMWRVTVQVDGSGECETNFELREKPSRDLVAQKTGRILKPGLNRIQLEPDGKYKFRGREHCFEVLADIERTRKPIDEREGFCARETAAGRWSMKERGDMPIKKR